MNTTINTHSPYVAHTLAAISNPTLTIRFIFKWESFP